MEVSLHPGTYSLTNCIKKKKLNTLCSISEIKILKTDEFDKYGIVRVTIGVIMGVLRACPKTNKIMTHFNLMRTQKYKF